MSQYQKGKTNLDFTEARDSQWQWHQLGHTQVCTSLQTDNHASTPPLTFLQAGCPSCRPTNSVRACRKIKFPNSTELLSNWKWSAKTLSACCVDVNGQLQQQRDIGNQRLQELRRFSEDIYQAVLWLRGHRQMFTGDVHEPMMLTVSTYD